MGVGKKARAASKPKKERPDDDDDDDSDISSEESEEEEVESEHSQRRRAEGRRAFMRLLRRIFSFVPLALTLAQQPFLIKPRAPGVNRAKMVPLQLACSGAIHWSIESATGVRNPQVGRYANMTARALFTPAEYLKARNSKLATAREQTWSAAYRKAKKSVTRTVDADRELNQIVQQPMPNIPLIGAYAATAGALLAPLLSGFEYLHALGVGAMMHSGRGLGMEVQPELYVSGALAVLGILVMDAAGKKVEAKRKRK